MPSVSTDYLTRCNLGLQAHGADADAGTVRHFDAHKALETQLGMRFDRFSYYATLNSATAPTVVTEYTAAIKPLLDSDPTRLVLLVLENYCAHPGTSGNIAQTITALRNPNDQFTKNCVALADAIVAAGHQDRLIICPGQECNGPGGSYAAGGSYPWQIYNAADAASTPAAYVQMFQAIVNTFRARGVTARWMQWYLTSNSGGSTDDFAASYAGDAYVDVLGISYYNRGGLASSGYSYWEAPGHNLRDAYSQMERMSARPIWMAESSCAEPTTDTTKVYYGESKARWFRDVLTMVRSGEFPRLTGYTLFAVDASVSSGEALRNWTLTTTEQQEAFAIEARKFGRPDARARAALPGTPAINLLPAEVEKITVTTGWSATAGITVAVSTDQPTDLPPGYGSIAATKPATAAGATSTSQYLRYTPADSSWYVPGKPYVVWAYVRVVGATSPWLVSLGMRQAAGSATFIGDDWLHVGSSWQYVEVIVQSGAATSGSWRAPFLGIGRNAEAGTLQVAYAHAQAGQRPS